MRKLGTVDIQYAQCLWGPSARVLSSIRDCGYNPKFTLIADDYSQVLRLMIKDDVIVEDMKSSSNAGAKKRIDIHIADIHLDDFLAILTPFVNSLSVKFDEASRQAPDPTGKEHPEGLPLGDISPITWVKAECSAYFSDIDVYVKTKSNGQMYLDAEKYVKGSRIHFGMRNIAKSVLPEKNSGNFIEIKLSYSQLKRFLHSIKVGKKWLK